MFRRPLFPLLIAWIAGILAARSLPFALPIGLLLAGAGLAGAVGASSKRAAPASIVALIAGVGALRTLAYVCPSPADLSYLTQSAGESRPGRRVTAPETTVIGRLANDPAESPGRLSFPLEVEGIVTRGRPAPAAGRVQVNLYAARRPRFAGAGASGKQGAGASPPAPGLPAAPRDRETFRATGASAAPDPFAPLRSLTFGERVSVTGRLELPRSAGNPGEFDDREYLACRGIRSVLLARIGGKGDRASPVAPLAEAGASWTGACLGVKRRLEAGLDATLPPRDAAAMEGLLFAESRRLPGDVRDDFVATGTVHLLSTSGIHVAALLLAVSFMLSPLRRRRKARALLLILFLAAFGVMAGGRPAVDRAVVMAALVCGAGLFDREADGMNLLCLAALALLIVDPLYLYDLGFQLSFTAIAGLLMLAPRIEPPMRALVGEKGEFRRFLVTALTASLAIEAALTPLLAVALGQVSPIAPLANPAVIPLSEPILPFGLFQAIAATVCRPIGSALGIITTGALWLFFGVVHLLARTPGALVYVVPPPPLPIVLYYAALTAWAKPWALKLDDPSPPSSEGDA